MQGNSEVADRGKITVRVDPELEDLVPGFLENRRGDIDSAREALESGDYRTLWVLGHRMKGSGGGYGFDAITDLGRDLEVASTERDVPAIRRLIGELADYLDRVEIRYG